ncbi:NADH-cytochrome b5 reductase [Viridothelium virens]|uniref:NADH-cytochrome b5 reductase n=1 Tax=Viridothelium virens TaxID=1048519 RepID=A0A6A6HEZ7_VIRVR|nr:NADH-cytochrome b5 reductase [Viridothelium virens]
MLARQVFRPANTFRSHVRRYATESSQGGSNTLLYGAIGASAVGLGYYFLSGTSKSEAPASKEERKQPPVEIKEPKAAFKGGDQGFISLKLDNVENINHNTKKFRFSLPEEDDVSGLKIASALITKYKGPEMEKPVIRPYTPTSDEDSRGFLDFVIKKYPNGPMSEHLHSMTPGQRLDMKGPIPKYPYEANKLSHIGMVAGGTGITPMYQVLRAIFKNPEDKTKVTLLYGNVSEDDILLKRELEDLENTYPQRLRVFYTVDKPSESWQNAKGFITKEMVKTAFPEPKTENLKIFVCGPPGMYKAISGTKNSPTDQGELSGILKDLGYSKDQVYKF